jgi:hypothetical protein
MGATQTKESRMLGREYAKRVTAQQYADMGDLNHATSYENKAAKYGYKADRTHARRFNRGKTPFPLAQHGLPAQAGMGGMGTIGSMGGLGGMGGAPISTMPLASEFIAAPTFPQQDFMPLQTFEQPLMMQQEFMQPMQTFETPMLNYQSPLNDFGAYDNVETIVMPTTVLPPIIAPASNYW